MSAKKGGLMGGWISRILEDRQVIKESQSTLTLSPILELVPAAQQGQDGRTCDRRRRARNLRQFRGRSDTYHPHCAGVPEDQAFPPPISPLPESTEYPFQAKPCAHASSLDSTSRPIGSLGLRTPGSLTPWVGPRREGSALASQGRLYK